MKKTISKLLALVMAVMLLGSLVLSAGATTSDLLGNNAQFEGGESCVANFSAADNPGIFALKFSKGMEAGYMAAFLVQHGQYRYIMTHEMAWVLQDEGYELTILGPNGSQFPTVCAGVDTDYDIGYLYTEGLEVFNPVYLEAEAFDGTIVGGIPYCDDAVNKFMRVEYKAFDFAKWNRVDTNLYSVPDLAYVDKWLGCPIFKSATEYIAYGLGTWYESGGNRLAAVINFNDLVLNANLSIELFPAYLAELEKDDGGSGGENPATKPTEKPEPAKPENSNTKWIVIGLVLAFGIGYWVYSGKQKEQAEQKRKQQEAQMAQAAAVEMTIPVSETAPLYTHGVTKAVSNWQLRCTNGPMSGKTYPLSGSTTMGRSSKCDISFPDGTAGVSGNHCEIVVSGDSVSIRDTGSTYGTFVNGNRIMQGTSQSLHASDCFSLAPNGPVFRLERVGGGMGGTVQAGPAVKDLQGKVYQSHSSGRLTFGRSEGNTVVLNTPNKDISSSHCVLYREGGKLYLKDLGSTNGTFFTEKDRLKPNTPYRIRKGQAFFLSSAKYTFVVTEE